MQKLLVLQSLWAVEGRFDDRASFTLEESIDRIAEAGFDGISAHWTDRREVRRAAGCLAGTALAVEGMCLPGTVDALKPILEIATEFPVHHLTVRPDLRPRKLEDGVALIEGWHRRPGRRLSS